MVSLVGTKSRLGNSGIKKYNSYLKSMVGKSSKIKDFIDISDCLSGSNSGFIPDNIHYNNATLKKI